MTTVTTTALALEAHGVRRAFGAVQAVVNASLSVQPGSVTALIGPNGCGKTTLMLMLAGLLRPDAGDVRVGGLSPTTSPKAARIAVGWMPDVLGTWESLTCRETLVTFARAYGLSPADADARAFSLLERVHLADLAAQPARVLSRGQKQRLSLARALVNDPPVLILDEPASGLDPRSRVELRDLVRELGAEGKAVLVSSHVLAELDEMVDDAIFMSKGVTLGADADAEVARARTRWRLVAVEGDLGAALAKASRDFTLETVPQGMAAVVSVVDDADAAGLVVALVGEGIKVARIAHVGSALEQAYLTLETERR
jgi:ABC-2 type transport system ATP-binding protein